MTQYGLFNDESADWTENEAVEADFWSKEAAEKALAERYTEEDELTIHEIEEPEEEDEDDEEDIDEDEDEE